MVWYWTAPAEVIVVQGKQAGGHVRGFQDGNPLHRSEIVPLVKRAVPDDVLGAGGIAGARIVADTAAEAGAILARTA